MDKQTYKIKVKNILSNMVVYQVNVTAEDMQNIINAFFDVVKDGVDKAEIKLKNGKSIIMVINEE